MSVLSEPCLEGVYVGDLVVLAGQMRQRGAAADIEGLQAVVVDCQETEVARFAQVDLAQPVMRGDQACKSRASG